jgi:hypothetical protein
MENIRHRHGTWVGGSLSRADIFFSLGKTKKICRVGG